MRTSSRLLAAVLAMALVAGCGSTPRSDVAATVNGTDISRDMLEDNVLAMLDDDVEMTDEERQAEIGNAQRELLGFLIQDAIYADVMVDEGIEVTDEDLAETRDRQIEALGGVDAYEAELAQFGVPLELFELIIRFETRNAALQQHVLDGQQARAVRHILVETEEEADEVIGELDGGADFAALAAERSQDPGSAQNGGAYPPAPRGAWVAEFEQAVWEGELNQTLGPVETQFGFHVIEVTEETELDPAELPPQQREQMAQEAVGAILQNAFESAEVTLAGGLGEWDAATAQVVSDDARVGEAPDAPGPPPAG